MPRETISENESLRRIWHYSKNLEVGLDPNTVTCGCHSTAWWKCDRGHEYDMPVVKKARNPHSCPLCTGHRIVAGVNDFATIYPAVAKEWHPTKNGNLLPSSFSKKSGQKVWWLGKCGHEWQATIHDRTFDGTSCPECNRRRSTSFPEQAILFYVKKLYPDAINRYKEIFDNGMELDIYVPSANIGIEFDGANWHKTEKQHQREIQKYHICKENGILLLRVKESNDESWNDSADHIWHIRKKATKKELEQIISAILYSIDRSENKWYRKTKESYIWGIEVNLDKDENEIRSYLTKIPNSIKIIRPDLIEEWDYKKNYPLTPDMFGINSNTYAYWKCHICGHEWRTTIIHRAGKRNSGCPECAKKRKGKSFTKRRVSERGSLADNNPQLARQWHPVKNGDLLPSHITENRFKPVWWLCEKCGHEWQASPNSRASGIGCPCCSGRVPKKGVNDLQTVNPNLAEEWNYEKNLGLKPSEFLPNSGKTVWWKCKSCGHEWQREIRRRNQGSYCPNCGHCRKRVNT